MAMPAFKKAGMVNLMPKRLKNIAKFLEYAELTADRQQYSDEYLL